MYREKGLCSEVSQMTTNIIRMYCRPLKCMPDVEGYLLKPSGPSFACAAPIHAVYPEITKSFYLYRNMHNVTLSIYKLSFIHPIIRLVYLLAGFSGAAVTALLRSAQFPTDGTNRTISNCHTSGIMLATLATKMYMIMKNEGLDVTGLLFDDILANKELAVRAIFKASGLPENLAADALKAFDRDSQSNSIISKSVFAKIKPLKFTKEHAIESNKLLVEMGYPPLEEECRLEGTIDFEKVLNMK
ncbi:hypothetical protein CAPTEDRAFT_216110 [Capitella teleta]|uniref:Sulfotransferase domain-containing protein n=1 Tax=Capitella teleta TaxID=283909 RepID=R7V928_CAPTE|nr:hypothetical protein CAPTEDRAFT_216110 [Capitella teleta]|eukprot:ELU15074.1 hypothetical protein CAPTEDRAFT_216110 [Capitella teleta]